MVDVMVVKTGRRVDPRERIWAFLEGESKREVWDESFI
jgi:hypothetical protein